MKRIALKKARLIAGMTEAEACTALRIRKERLHAWETGKSVPSFDHAVAMAKAYDMSIDYLDFSKEANTPPAARKLTLKEIETLPKASVIWMGLETHTDEGILFYDTYPIVVCVAGKNAVLAGADADLCWHIKINAEYFSDKSDYSFWNIEPGKAQLIGISADEYNNLNEKEDIVFHDLATAITSRGITLQALSDMTGIKIERIYKILSDMDEIVQSEIVAIGTALNLSDDEKREIFFPEFVGNVYDSHGRLIEPAAVAQI